VGGDSLWFYVLVSCTGIFFDFLLTIGGSVGWIFFGGKL